MPQNLEELVATHAERMAQRMRQEALASRSEEEVRHACNRLIDEFISAAEIKVSGRHEYGLAGGWIDSKYGGVIIEYKAPRGSSRLGAGAGSPGCRAVVAQFVRRLEDFRTAERVAANRILGVGCDGESLVFVRSEAKGTIVDGPVPVTPYSAGRLLRALLSLGVRGQSFTAKNLAAHFGSGSPTAQEGIRLVFELIRGTANPKARAFFKQWEMLFGEVCGYDIHRPGEKMKKLARYYGTCDEDPAALLFSLHTYYAIFVKLLAAEIVSSFSPLGTSPTRRIFGAATSAAVRNELVELERGGIWAQLGVRNFMEGDLFSWYVDAWTDGAAQAIRGISHAFDQFDPTTLSIAPEDTRDLLKHLYQHLFPRNVRHDLGEYYTPDWLANLVLDEVGYDGNPDKRLLDPACGSGTFLVAAIGRAKAWYAQHRADCGFREEGLLARIVKNIVGFDLNPLAVMAARTNYLIAVREFLRHAGGFEIPVYLCDSVGIPARYADLETGRHGRVRKLATSIGSLLIPTEVTEDREVLGKYTNIVELSVRNGYSSEEFLLRCSAEGLPTGDAEVHSQLYAKLKSAEERGKNGVWARVIKNAFAPLFLGQVDCVVGNPPWINWESLPPDYRERLLPIWKNYGLLTLSGKAGRLGGGKKDLSMLFVYCGAEHYLKDGGRLGFVITQTVFKSHGAGDGFRRLSYSRNGVPTHLVPLVVHDLSALQVFEGASNRAAVFVSEKRGTPFAYPVPYCTWSGPFRIAQEVSLPELREMAVETRMVAAPVSPLRPTSPWLTASATVIEALRKVVGHSDYKGSAGSCTWLNGVFWVRIVEKLPGGRLLIENLYDVGKHKVAQVQAAIEPQLVFPLLRGRDVGRWLAAPSAHIILPQDPSTRQGIPETTMKLRYPLTYAYFKQFEGPEKEPQAGTLRGRAGYRKYFKSGGPFYATYNVAAHTFAEWKVVWREQSSIFMSAPVGPLDGVPVVPDHKLMLVQCHNEAEALYLSTVLNSSPARLAFLSFALSTSQSAYVLDSIAVPRWNEKEELHLGISHVGSRCRAAAAADDEGLLSHLAAEVDQTVGRLWGLSEDDARRIGEALAARPDFAQGPETLDGDEANEDAED